MSTSSLLSLYMFRLVLFALPCQSRIFGFFFKDLIKESSSLRSCSSVGTCLLVWFTYSLTLLSPSFTLLSLRPNIFFFFFFLTLLLSCSINIFTCFSSQHSSLHIPSLSLHHCLLLSPLQIFFFTVLPPLIISKSLGTIFVFLGKGDPEGSPMRPLPQIHTEAPSNAGTLTPGWGKKQLAKKKN
jgi:hypothetical protein